MNVNSAYSAFSDIVLNAINKAAPEHMVHVSAKSRTVESWVKKGICQSGKKLRQFYKKTIEVNAPDDIIVQYTKHWNNYNRLKRITKIKYYHEKCNAYKSNIKKLWKLINGITGKVSNKTSWIELLKINSVEHYMPKDISNYLGDYFANVGKQYAQKIVPSSTHINDYLSKIDQNITSFYVLSIDRDEIINLVLALPNEMSSGYENISNVLLKNYTHAFYHHLNISLTCQF